MGIPREVALLRNQSNFMFQGINKMGPGDYNPEKPKANLPTSYFSKDKSESRVAEDPS